jgi:hypothetical protein
MLAPPAGSQPLPGWTRGHCRYPEDRVPPRTSFESRQRLQLLPPGEGQLRGCHVSPWLRLSARGSSGAATYPHDSGSLLLA